jgi:farnesyl diphosphate synthase
MATGKKQYAEGHREKFMSVFTELTRELTQESLHDPEISDGIQHLKRVLEYNIPHGKCNRGLMVVGSLHHLLTMLTNREPTDDEVKDALILGWCVEWLQGFFLVADDIMDQSKTRRGQPCWYKIEGVGLVAINDSFIIESTIYRILKRYFRDKPYYLNLMELFHETTYQTEVGQCLDLITSPNGNVDLSKFSMERYKAIVKYKTAFYSFYLPVAIAMYMVGISDDKSHSVAKNILLPLGEFFQIQDDYLDCYGDPAVTGKIGTDIEECKCSWLVVQALQRVTSEQRKLLEEHYGRDDAGSVQIVKGLYDQLNMRDIYQTYEEASYQELMILIENELKGTLLPQGMFQEFSDRIYKRKK